MQDRKRTWTSVLEEWLKPVCLATPLVWLSACAALGPQPAILSLEQQTNKAHPSSSAEAILARNPPLHTLASGRETLLFASDRAGNGDIFVAEPGRAPVNLTNHPAGDWDASWSPTCRDPMATCRIAFTSHRSGDSEIWVMDQYGANLVNVTQHPAWDYWPAWSPDGTCIAFISERDGDPELFVQALDGSPAIQLTFNTESDRLPAWSPDGTRIAFATVRGDMEEIHIINSDGSDEQVLTRWPLRASAPAWSPDGRQIAFVGWADENRLGIYLLEVGTHNAWCIWQGESWIGSLSWSPGISGTDGSWLLFTSWQDSNHELYALSPYGVFAPVRITHNLAWDDFPDLRYGTTLRPDNWLLEADALRTLERTTPPTPPDDDFAYGFNIADLSKAYLMRDLNLHWAKGYVNWETVEPRRGRYRWVDPDNTVAAFQSHQLRILLRVHGTPAWARPPGTFLSYPPDNMEDFGHFMEELARRYRGQVAAYEIWNEPNLNYEWGYLDPDPERYTQMLQTAFRAVKAVDPQALVISGGLATTGQGSPTAMGDLEFLERMYAAGARGYFDAMGSHPYPFGNPPDYRDTWGLSLERVAEQHQVMLAHGDLATPVWITELGWVLHTSWNLVEHEAIGVNELEQASYLSRAYEKIRTEWPWVRGLFIFNLDFSAVPWYTAAEPMRWYAVLNPDRTPRPAYTSIRSQMMDSSGK
ncbi:MAG: cellulase family glycosylhydrolase [Anaerolineae bacterium]